jgi:hypothetical protein
MITEDEKTGDTRKELIRAERERYLAGRAKTYTREQAREMIRGSRERYLSGIGKSYTPEEVREMVIKGIRPNEE